MLSGTALTAKGMSNSCRVIGVEPELADDATRSFRTRVLAETHNPPTIADGLRTPSLGKVTFPLVLENVDEMVTVSEKEIVDAMRFLWTRMKLVVEPSGAVAVSAVMRGDAGASARSIGVIISGGNVDMQTACGLLNEEAS